MTTQILLDLLVFDTHGIGFDATETGSSVQVSNDCDRVDLMRTPGNDDAGETMSSKFTRLVSCARRLSASARVCFGSLQGTLRKIVVQNKGKQASIVL